jgi:hypothetical protein
VPPEFSPSEHAAYDHGGEDGDYLGRSLSSVDRRSVFNDPTIKHSESEHDTYDEGFAKSAAKDLRTAVSRILAYDSIMRDFHDYQDGSQLISDMDRAVDVYYQQNGSDVSRMTSRIMARPEVQDILPEIALVGLAANFDDIHDSRRGNVLTKSELQDYITNCKSNPTDKVALSYALQNFDQLSNLDPDSDGISSKGVAHGIKEFGKLEQEKTALLNLSELRPTLTFLSNEFDRIHKDPDFSGISDYELKRYLNNNCSEDATSPERAYIDRARSNFETISRFDESDGERSWNRFWTVRSNADGITRADINFGLQEIPKRLDEIDQRIRTWDKWVKSEADSARMYSNIYQALSYLH